MKKKILIVEDNIALSQRLRDRLERCGYAVETAIDEPSARRLIRKSGFDLVLADVRLPKGDGLSLLEWLNGGHRHVPFVVMTGYANYPDAVRAVKSGADDYLPKPVDPERLLDTVRELLRPLLSLPQGGKTLFRLGSPAAREVERMATLVAPVEVSVLILGANGTGKESVARRIHEESDRRLMPFVAVNCSVISKELAPSLLFGHAKGSFTGAEKDTEGYFGMAEGGTLFLDEIGTLGYEAQSMLLRVLQEGTYTPVGGNRERRADVRIVAATNEDLAQGIRENRFREDLYHRLAEFEIRLPALRECRADILPLAGFFRERFSSELRKPTEGFTPEAEERLLSYPWPGNIREMQNRVRRAVLLAESPLVGTEELDIPDGGTSSLTGGIHPHPKGDAEWKSSIEKALALCGGHRGHAAALLHVSEATLYRKMKKYGVK